MKKASTDPEPPPPGELERFRQAERFLVDEFAKRMNSEWQRPKWTTDLIATAAKMPALPWGAAA